MKHYRWKFYWRGPFGWNLRTLFVFDVRHPEIRRIGPFGFSRVRIYR